MHFPFLLAAGSWLIFLEYTLATLLNVTIDDTYGDPMTGAQVVYVPGPWNNGTNCSGCTAHPAVSQTYLQTWHDNTWNRPVNDTVAPEVQTASAYFNGSAVYIYCVIAHSLVAPDGNSDMTFFIDNETVGHYVLLPSGAQPTYSYNVNVYANSSVPPGPHTITIQNGLLGQKALIMLDYITYSYDNGTSSLESSSINVASTHKPGRAMIAGATVGALSFLSLLGLASFLIFRHRRRLFDDSQNGFVVDSFPPPTIGDGGWIAGPALASRPITQTPSQSASSGPSRKTGPGIFSVTHGRVFPDFHAGYAGAGTSYPGTNSFGSGQNDIEVGPARDTNTQWNALLTPRRTRENNRELVTMPESSSSASPGATQESVPQDDPPAYSDAGRDPIVRIRGGEDGSFRPPRRKSR